MYYHISQNETNRALPLNKHKGSEPFLVDILEELYYLLRAVSSPG